jgi:hypothetical protein
MILYFGTNYTSTSVGDALRGVRCEQCGGEYFYTACRITTGHGTSPYNLNNAGAAEQADAQAMVRLDEALRNITDPVPCPHCGWLQSSMMADVRRRRYGWLKVVALLVAASGVAAIAVSLLWNSHAMANDQIRLSRFLAMVVVFAVGAAGWVGVDWVLGETVSGIPAGRRRFAGPPALVKTPRPETSDPLSVQVPGRTLLAPAPAALVAGGPILNKGWVTLQLQKVNLPAACACCLAAPEVTYGQVMQSRISLGDALPQVPLCRGCAESLRLRWWVNAALIGLGVIILSFVATYSFPRRSSATVGVLVGAGAVVGALFGPFVAARITPPHRCRTVDAGRGFYRLKFSNPEYTGRLVEAWTAPATHARVVASEELAYLIQSAAEDRRAA